MLVAVDPEGRVARVVDRQRLLVRGKGDYQVAISAPVEDVRSGPGSESEPGLRADQVLWAGFSPGRKLLSADVILRPRAAGAYLPVRLRVRRDGDRVTLTVTNATPTGEQLYAGTTHPPELARLLDETRRASLAGRRLTAAYATFVGLVRVPKRKVPIEAPLRVDGELTLPGQAPVSFSRTLGDGRPLSFQVEGHGSGTPKVHLLAQPVAVVRLLRPPGAATWVEVVRRRSLPAPFLLRRLLETRTAARASRPVPVVPLESRRGRPQPLRLRVRNRGEELRATAAGLAEPWGRRDVCAARPRDRSRLARPGGRRARSLGTQLKERQAWARIASHGRDAGRDRPQAAS